MPWSPENTLFQVDQGNVLQPSFPGRQRCGDLQGSICGSPEPSFYEFGALTNTVEALQLF